MNQKVFLLLLPFVFFLGCSSKQQPIATKSATIIFKTPSVKFYDKGFVEKYDEKVHLSIFNIGIPVFSLDIYENKICQGAFSCLDGAEFNKQILSPEYKKDFLYNLFKSENINFKDLENGIFIKVLYDELEHNSSVEQ